jgi:hypothetical protein
MSRLTRHNSRPRLLLVLVAVALLWTPASARANAVDFWSLIAHRVAVTNAGRAGLAQIDFAYVHIAIYDAVNAIDGRYSVFAVKPQTYPVGASMEAATAAAAYTMLKWLYPLQTPELTSDYNAYLGGIADGDAKTRGIAVGTEVANNFIALRTGDGRDAPTTYVFGSGPGVYQRTPLADGVTLYTGQPVGPWVANFKTFGIRNATQFRAPGPVKLNSARWAQDYNETKLYGVKTGSLRSAEQTAIGLFYSDNPGTQGNRNVRNTAAAYGLSLADSARFFAQLYVSMADAQITTWNSKYFYSFWRPVTAIRAGDTDGNAKTDRDAVWVPLVVTPQHPEYPAAHPTVTGAFAYALEEFFDTKHVDVTLTSTTPGALASHHFTNTRDIVKDVINGRIYGGMHYRTSGEHGAAIARSVARYIARNYFRKIGDDADDEGDDVNDDDADEQ